MKFLLTLGLAVAVLPGCTSKVESEFKAGCRSSGVPKAFCSCAYDKLEDKLKAAEKRPSLMFSTEFKAAYSQAIEACR